MRKKTKAVLMLLWIIFFYIAHYYFAIKKYLPMVRNYIPFFW